MGRANGGVVTINLPRIAIEAEKDEDTFFEILDKRLETTLDILKWRYNRLISLKAKEVGFSYLGGAFGLEFDPEETIEKAFANGRGSLSVGYIGLHEVVLTMFGKEVTECNYSLEFQKRVLKFINNKLECEKNVTKLLFNCYSTPSESLTERFCNLDMEKFGTIKGITDKGFYINSYHVNTETVISPFEKIDIEAKLQPLALGGHISYVEANNMRNNQEAYKELVKYAYKKGIMHFAINSPWDHCKTCHWTGELELQEELDHTYECPSCGETDPSAVTLTRRLCGYVASINNRPPVQGRVKEMISRIKHT